MTHHQIGIFLIVWIISFIILGSMSLKNESDDAAIITVLILSGILSFGIALL